MRTRARSRWLCRESWAIMHRSDTRTHRRHAWRPRLQRTAQGQLTPEPYPITGSIWSHSNFKERVGDSKGQWHISRWYSGLTCYLMTQQSSVQVSISLHPDEYIPSVLKMYNYKHRRVQKERVLAWTKVLRYDLRFPIVWCIDNVSTDACPCTIWMSMLLTLFDNAKNITILASWCA